MAISTPCAGQGPDEQEGGQVLTAHRPGQAGLAARETAAPDNHRGTVIAFLGGGRDPEVSERPRSSPMGRSLKRGVPARR